MKKSMLIEPNPNHYDTFFDWFIDKRVYGNKLNQMEVVSHAKIVKKFLTGELLKLPSNVKWLHEKLTNSNNRPENYLVDGVSPLTLCNEIINPRNATSKKLFAKPYMKQSVEEDQLKYLHIKYNLEFSRGKNGYFPITASGVNSYRFTKDGQFQKNIKRTNNTSKSIDSILIHNDYRFWTTQKVTTDDGGATNSVNDDIVKFLRPNHIYLNKFGTSNEFFLYLLDGPFWKRKDRQSDIYNRIETLKHQFSHPNIIICDSDEFGKLYGSE